MRIKRLELMGFKSFLEKTIINFGEGLTGIVGPNGCGKSNIVDALLWVMGEQSPKSLRGGSMEDIIFNGSDNRKPASLSEVSLTLENDGAFPVKYLNFSEITVTRRLYRNGDSEYLINKTPVRLKDVKELFMDSGARAYAVIEQGEIERLIVARPEERRTLIEEAAGITRYKARKEESARKLETTEQNLLRLNDIIAELSRQLNQLERQAKKAEEYRKIRDDIRNIELSFAARELAEIDGSLSSLRETLLGKEHTNEEITVLISRLEMELEKAKADKLAIEDTIKKMQEESVHLNTDVHKDSAKIEMLEKERTELVAKREQNVKDIEIVRQRVEKTETEFASIDGELSSFEQVMNSANEEVNRSQEELQHHMNAYDEFSSSLEGKRSELLDIVHKDVTARNNISNFEERFEGNNIKIEKLVDEKSKTETALNCSRETSSILATNIHETDSQRTNLETGFQTRMQRLGELDSKYKIKENERNTFRSKMDAMSSRFDALTELAEKYEGVSDGVRALMGNEGTRGSIVALFADVIETRPEYEKAVQSVLGEQVESMIINNSHDAIGLIHSLKHSNGGRASFVPLTAQGGRTHDLGLTSREGVIAPLYELINFDDRFIGLINAFFSNVYLVHNIETALWLWSDINNPDLVFVTPDGDLVDCRGVIRGGSETTLNSGLLERKREIKQLEEDRASLELELLAADSDCTGMSEEMVILRQEIEDHKAQLSEVAIRLVTSRKEFEVVGEDIRRLEEKLSVINFDLEQLRFENGHLEREINEARTVQTTCSERKTVIENELAESKFALSQLSSKVEESRARLTELKVNASSFAERFRNIDDKKKFLQESLAGDRGRLDAIINEDVRADARISEIDKQFGETKWFYHENMSKLDELTRIQSEVSEQLRNAEGSVNGIDEQLRTHRSGLMKEKDSIMELTSGIAELTTKTGLIKQKYFDKYELDILQCYHEYLTHDFSPEESKVRLDELNGKLNTLGQVNLLAVEEFERLNQRYKFLSDQREDLIKSMDDLREAIKKIDDTSRERFKRTFELVNERFKRIFPILFGGGRAQLDMVNPDDLLNTGIDISAQLPGKRTQSISLFSGGEKALTAISLVFAIFAIKPSPFCVLDEVDAPLDDANITRFNDAVNALMGKTQFIVITHNKVTMEMVDVLYGVTMEEPGVSRMVSVKISELEKTATDTMPVSLDYSSPSEETLVQ